MTVSIMSCADGAALTRATAAWIARDPAGMALVASVAAIPGAWSAVVAVDGGPAIALAHTPPRLVLLAAVSDPQPATVAAVAALLAERDAQGLSAPPKWADALRAAVSRRVGASERHRLHTLRGSPRLPRPTSGSARWAREEDIEQVRGWRDGFVREAMPRESLPPASADSVRAGLGDILIWCDDGRPTAMAARTRPILGGWSISWVYAPPEERRRGYAGALVHALAERLLADGARYVALYTDLANPTSNRLYAGIGFVPESDRELIFWERP